MSSDSFSVQLESSCSFSEATMRVLPSAWGVTVTVAV